MVLRAEVFRRALLALAGRSERAGVAAVLRLCWRTGISREAAIAGCPEGARLLWCHPATLGRRLEDLAAGVEVLDAMLLTGAGIAWLGPPPERLAGA